ncbi:MAG: DUF1858 domain-containing protein [candidate division Zixibacteria bacterium]|nr:DUF1858 domain-containing protein [candidate division Zixibacteria bacterium]
MSEKKLIISPKTKVGELLDAFPQLENVLLELSPSFAKLKNPILRKTVARIASLQQAAIIGGLKVDELVNRLRKEVGQAAFNEETENSQYILVSPPDWFDAAKVSQRFDASPIINAGGSPMSDILGLTHQLQTGEIFELHTPFIPAPIIDMLKNRGFKVYSVQKSEVVVSYVSR